MEYMGTALALHLSFLPAFVSCRWVNCNPPKFTSNDVVRWFCNEHYTVAYRKLRVAGCETVMNPGGYVTVEFLNYIRVRERMNTVAVGSFLTPAPPHYPPFHTFPPRSYSKEPRT